MHVPEAIGRQLVDPASYGDPQAVHESLAWLRGEMPFAKVQMSNFDPFWIVTRHADILDIERQADLFHSGDRSTVMLAADMREALEAAVGSPHLVRSMIAMDGREHRAYRTLTQAWFMPGNVKKLEDKLRGLARAHVDRMFARNGRCDFVADVALHYPLHVIMEILGVPEEDEGLMLSLTQQLFGAHDPELGREAEVMATPDRGLAVFQNVIADFHRYFEKLTDERRREPREDVASIIANAVIDGAPISKAEANGYYVLVATAGHDTTSASTAGGMLALARDPELLATLRGDASLVPAFVEEAIRWVTPVKHFMRSAARDTEVNGQAVAAGDWLMLSYMSGNRDEAVFDHPAEFRLDRPANKQLAFGYGPHMCIGQHLAKLEMRILFEELVPRLNSVELDGEPTWARSNFVSGPKRLPIKFG